MDQKPAYATEEEIAQLREEVRRLREDREPQQHGDGHDAGDGDRDRNAADQQQRQKKNRPLRKFILIGAALVIVVVAVAWWLHSRHYESTDDAIVEAHTSGIAARIAGTVTAVYVEENQFVKSGQVVADLDPRDYQAAVSEAKGQLRQATGQAAAQQPNIPVTTVTNATNIASATSAVAGGRAGVAAAERNYDAAQERVREAEANNAKAQADVERYRPLAEKDEVPREQFDQVLANAKALSATLAAAQASAQAALRQVDQSRDQLAQAEDRAAETEKNAPRQLAIQRATVGSRQGGTEMAQAQLAQAMLNLSYCKITTPVDGIVARRSAEVGMHVTPGQELILVTQLNDLWVTANFRETQIRRMHPGESVQIHVDALDQDFGGYVEGMPAASGAVTSLLPPENATGNFVKIVQRLPVRIRFQQGQKGLDRLRPGMSVEPKVRID